MKNILSLVLFMLMFSWTNAQLAFYTNDFSETIEGQEFNCPDLPVLGVKVPVDEDFLKYDKVLIRVNFINEDGNPEVAQAFRYRGVAAQYYPQSKIFKDKHEGEKELEVYVIGEKDSYYYCDLKRGGDRAYKVTVDCFFESGVESYYDENSKTVKTKKTYSYSKTIHSSGEFSIKLDQSEIEDAKNNTITYDAGYDIQKAYTKTVSIPVVGDIQPNIDIFNAYGILHDALRDNKEYERLMVVQKKLMEIKDDKLKSLNKSIKGETNLNKIEELILAF